MKKFIEVAKLEEDSTCSGYDQTLIPVDDILWVKAGPKGPEEEYCSIGLKTKHITVLESFVEVKDMLDVVGCEKING